MTLHKLIAALALVVIPTAICAKNPNWDAPIKKFEAMDAQTSTPQHGILFVGSSSIVAWKVDKFFPGLPVINRGFGGSVVSDVNDYYDRVVKPYNPDTIVFYSGDNDISGGKTTETVIADLSQFTGRVRKDFPQARLILIPPKPSPSRMKFWPLYQEIAAAEKAMAAADDKIDFMDPSAAMMGPDGQPRKELFRPDMLHMIDDGYVIWSDMLRPMLNDSTSTGTKSDDSDTSPKLQVREIKPGVWLQTTWYTYPDGKRFPSNGLIVAAHGSLTLIDTAWGEILTVQLLDKIAREIKLPVKQAVVTHFHYDRLAGVDVMEERGIQVYGTALTQDLAAKTGMPVPDHSLSGLDKPGTLKEVGGLQVFFPGAAHSPDNLMVWLPEQKILFGGCAVRDMASTSLGNMYNADKASWPVAIRAAQKQFPSAEIVVPGHGKIGGSELLSHTLDLL